YRPLHVLNAARLAMYFGVESGMSDAHIVQLGIVALLYDLGPFDPELDFILEGRKLSSVEFSMVEEISLRGAEVLEGLDGIDPLCATVAHEHHERADGTGYPSRSKAEDQHPYSRLIQIIDSFLGMIEPRAFRPAISPIEAMQRLAVQAHRGYYYEAAFRDWLKVMGVYPVGSFVKLNSGEVALIRKSGGDKLRRPTVDILTDDLLDFRARPFELDMMDDPDVEIACAVKEFTF
ncbi:MAG: hypothetical protein KDB07_10540, partial [Planctomycetes bacterium]|nr:hypothetical protein [Planctomycetota bacterium]